MQRAQVVGVLSKGEGVVAAGGHLVTELDPLARHPEKVNVIEYPFSFFFLERGNAKLKAFQDNILFKSWQYLGSLARKTELV